MNTIVLDIGGSAVKVWRPGASEPVKVPTGKDFTAGDFVSSTKALISDDSYDRVSIGYPGLVRWGQPAEEPVNLGGGWVGRDYSQEFDCAVRILNDADMQALGGYAGGRMLYLGLGTGVGTSMIVDWKISPLALGLLPYKDGKKFDAFLTKEALDRIGLDEWRKAAAEAAALFKDATIADYVLLGGSGAERFDKIPPGCRSGGNLNAYFGGLRMWEDHQPLFA
jgi:predicted NBD/HSP70 family sugar kinase